MPGGELVERKAGTALAMFAGLLLIPALLLPRARADDPTPPRAYDLTIETVMPNLEEALRYTTVRETRCVGWRDLLSAFPILRHDSLKGCRLERERNDGETVSYLLVCDGGNATTGAALWRLDGKQLLGVLEIKFGGKNMTVSQRVTARSLGACAPGAE